MGCAVSTTKTYRAPIVSIDLDTPREAPEITQIQHSPSFYFKDDVKSLLQGVAKIPKPPNIKTCVVISGDSFPIFTAPLYFPNGDETTISLPVIACSRHFKGRLILSCSFDLLLRCRPQNTDASVFLENIIRWVSGDRRGDVKIGTIGIDYDDVQAIRKNVEGFGFKVKTGDDAATKSHCMIVTTSFKDVDIVRSCLDNGTGVILCYYDLQNNKINDSDRNHYDDLLLEAGIPFSRCELTAGNPTCDSMKCSTENSLLKLNINHLISKLKKIISSDNINIGKLDSVITLLRMHCNAFDSRNSEHVSEIFKIITGFLFNIELENETDICPSIESKIVTILLSELLDKIPPSELAGIDLSDIFPGKTGNIILSTYKIEILPLNQWISTGVWLPPGIIANVDFDKPLKSGCLIQIGSCAQSLVSSSQSMEWKRWPVVTLTYQVNGTHAEVATPFGGIIYFIFEDAGDSFEVTISNVCRYPLLSYTNESQTDEIWEQTKDVDVPFGEMELKNCVFSLPSAEIRKQSVQKFAKRIDNMISLVFDFTALKESKQMRIVFDIEVPADYEPVDSYPIYINPDTYNKLVVDEPSKELFIVLANAALFSLPESTFSPEGENILVLLSACAIMQKVYPSSKPMDYIEGVPPNNFIDMWQAYITFDKLAITKAFARIRKLENNTILSENEIWEAFIQEYETTAKTELPQLKELAMMSAASSSLNLNSMRASQSLNDFIVTDNEIEVMK